MHPLKFEKKNISLEYLYVTLFKYCVIKCCFIETHKNTLKYLLNSHFFSSEEGLHVFKSETN